MEYEAKIFDLEHDLVDSVQSEEALESEIDLLIRENTEKQSAL